MSNYATGPISGFTEKIPVSSDILPIVDTSDPLVKNKKSTVGNLFKAVPYSSGSTSPAIAFGSSTNSGLFSPDGTQVGIRIGNTSSLLVTKNTGNVTIASSDNSVSSLDLNFQALGTGKISFSSPVNFTANNFVIASQSNFDNNFKFDVSNILGSITLGIPGSGGTIVTETAPQVLLNKTFTNTSFLGNFSVNPSTNDFIVVGNKVGIGIASPDYKLHVSSDIKISGQTPSLRLTGLSTEYQFINNNGVSLEIWKDSNPIGVSFYGTGISITSSLILDRLNYNNRFDLLGSGTTFLSLDNSGYLGAGTTNPQQRLHVNGSAIISDGIYKPNNSSLAVNYTNSTTYHYSNQDFRASSGSTTSNLFVSSSGLVGIGTSNPDYALHVIGNIKSYGVSPLLSLKSDNAEYQIVNNTNTLDVNKVGTGTLLSISSSSITIPRLYTDDILYNNDLKFIGSGNTYGTLSSTGSLGLGITTPVQKLHVVGSALISGGLFRPDNSSLLMNYDNTTTYHYSNQEFRTGPFSVSPNVIITSLGSIGIGKSTPTVPLDVVGRIRNTGVLYSSTLGRKIVTNTLSGGILNIDLDSGSVYSFLLNQNINTINYTYSGGSADTTYAIEITLIISHDGNPYTINWNPAAPNTYRILWVPSGGFGSGITASVTAPTLQTAGPGAKSIPSKDIITLTSYDGGNTFLGRYVAAIPAS